MIAVFVRRSNDIDHLTPVVWALATRAGQRVAVLCMNPFYDVETDYRLRWLRTVPGVTIEYAARAHAPSPVHRAVAALALPSGRPARGPRRFPMTRWWDSAVEPRLYDRDWAGGLLRHLGAKVAVFDWVKPGQHLVQPLLEAARACGIPTVSLPHGVTITTGELRTAAAMRAGRLPEYDRLFPFDWFVAPHHDHAAYFARGGMPWSRMAVLGSARFCEEWVAEHLRVLAGWDRRLPARPGALRVVFMDKRSATSKRDEVVRALRALTALDTVQLVLKPDTRSEATDLPHEFRPLMAADEPSAGLVAWADVVVGTVSSVLIEPLVQGKPLVYPSYLCGIGSRLEELQACWRVESLDDLLGALCRLAADRRDYPVAPASVERFLDEVVYAGEADRDVLGRYCRFILERAAGREPELGGRVLAATPRARD